VLLGGADGSLRVGFTDAPVAGQMRLAIAQFRTLRPDVRASTNLVLKRVYRNLVRGSVRSLAACHGEAGIRETMGALPPYPLAGLHEFFA